MTLSEDSIYLEDDWDDNALTNRTGSTEGYFLHPSDTLISDYEAGDVLKSKYRPEWDATKNPSNFSVSSGELNWSAGSGNAVIRTASEFATGSVAIDVTWSTVGNDSDQWALGIHNDIYGSWDGNNAYQMTAKDNGGYELRLYDGGSVNVPISSTWATDTNTHTNKFTRDSFGNLELFEDNTSKGTSTDTTFSTFEIVIIGFQDSDGSSSLTMDNLEVK